MKNKLNEIEIARGFAIIGVLMIHGTSKALSEISEDSSFYIIYLILNRIGHFSVPTFVLLSGLVLSYRYFETLNFKESVSFFRKRFQYVAVPYMIWTAFYYVFNLLLYGGSLLELSTYQFLYKLATGSAGYHLYFMVLIVQYYLIFPLMIQLGRKFTDNGMVLLLILSFVIQIITALANNHFQWISDKSILFTTYLVAFSIGAYIGANYSSSVQRIHKRKPLFLTLMILLMAGHVLNSTLGLSGGILKEIIVQSYSIITALSLIILGRFLLAKNFDSVANLMKTYGICAFGIYLIHPAVLSFAELLSTHFSEATIFYNLVVLVRIAIIFIVPSILVLLIKKIKWGWILIGK